MRHDLAEPARARLRPFRPPWWAPGAHAQTLAGRFLRRPPRVPLERERWSTPDGDFLDLDFTPDPDPSAPLALVLHGLEGSARRAYCLCTYAALAARGVPSVGLNFRGCSGEPNLRARAYHSGETGDAAWVLDRLRARHPERAFFAVGFSLGGNVLLRLLAELAQRDERGLAGAAAVSVPYDLGAGADHLARSRIGRLYTRHFLRSLVASARAKEHLLAERVDLDAAAAARTLRDFDDRVTAPLHGFRSAEDYYRQSSSAGLLDRVRTPTLLIHAEDDPFLPHSAIPLTAIAENPDLHLSLTPRGGHVGFLQGSPLAPETWAEASVARFLAGTRVDA